MKTWVVNIEGRGSAILEADSVADSTVDGKVFLTFKSGKDIVGMFQKDMIIFYYVMKEDV